MKILLTGATGFAGGEVLRQALLDDEITEVTVLTRRPLSITHPRLRQVVMSDFMDYTGLDLSGHDACIWCLGVSQTQVGKDDYIRITLDYAVAAARAMHAANPALRFCFVSGQSADPTEARSSLYAKIKGRTERVLGELGGPLHIFRPGYIRPTAASGPRTDFARWFGFIGSLIALFNADRAVDCDQLARCLLGVAKHGSEKRLLANRDIRLWPAP
jgi:uncharacterized protein YbjT (DUF2867 family)